MSLTTREYEEFITEIKVLTNERKYNSFLNNMKKSLEFWSTAKKILSGAKDGYDVEFTKICNRYGLNTEEIQNELDKAWEDGSIISRIPTLTGPAILHHTFNEYRIKSLKIAERFFMQQKSV